MSGGDMAVNDAIVRRLCLGHLAAEYFPGAGVDPDDLGDLLDELGVGDGPIIEATAIGLGYDPADLPDRGDDRDGGCDNAPTCGGPGCCAANPAEETKPPAAQKLPERHYTTEEAMTRVDSMWRAAMGEKRHDDAMVFARPLDGHRKAAKPAPGPENPSDFKIGRESAARTADEAAKAWDSCVVMAEYPPAERAAFAVRAEAARQVAKNIRSGF